MKKEFREVDPWNSEDASLKRRNLPHIQALGATYFVTFRSNIVLSPAVRDLVMAEIHAGAEKSIELDAAVVMPDHVHMIFRLLDADLSHVLKSIKGRSARGINRILCRQGRVWIEESFDHIIRSEAELEEKLEYAKQNPVKRGLVKQPEEYKWLILRV
jgi:REP element-mobilizing transposase RayT